MLFFQFHHCPLSMLGGVRFSCKVWGNRVPGARKWDLSGSLVGFQWEFSGISVGVWWDWCGLLVGTAHPEPESGISGNLVGFKWEFGGLQVGAWWDLSRILVGLDR